MPILWTHLSTLYISMSSCSGCCHQSLGLKPLWLMSTSLAIRHYNPLEPHLSLYHTRKTNNQFNKNSKDYTVLEKSLEYLFLIIILGFPKNIYVTVKSTICLVYPILGNRLCNFIHVYILTCNLSSLY